MFWGGSDDIMVQNVSNSFLEKIFTLVIVLYVVNDPIPPQREIEINSPAVPG